MTISNTISHGNFLNGFPAWFAANFEAIKAEVTPEVEAHFKTLESFAIEIYCEIIAPSSLDNVETINTIVAI